MKNLPVLLLIPGMLNTAAVWAPVAKRLSSHAEVRIANVQTQASIAEMARDAWALVADVPINTPLVVCGFSMGGYVTIEMLAACVRPVGAIGLLDTSARPETPEGALIREKTISAIERNFARMVDNVALLGTSAETQTQPLLMAAIRQTMMDVGPDCAIRQNRAIMDRGDYRDALTRITTPSLVMCGREDRITPPNLSEELASLIPGARLEWIDNAGHMGLQEQPDQVAEYLMKLLLHLT